MSKLEPTYRDAIVKSWHFVWHHKILWILSLLAVVFTQFGLNDFLGQLWLLVVRDTSAVNSWWSLGFWQGITIPNGVEFVGTLWLFIILLALGALVTVITICAQGALIAASCAWFKNRTVPKIDKIWSKGVKHFWRLLAVNIAQKIMLVLILISTAALLDLQYSNMFFTIGIVLGSFLLALIVSSITIFAAGYIVEKEYSFFEALRAAGQMFFSHILVTLELSVVILLLNVVLIIVVAGSSVLALVPSFFIWIVGGFTGYVSLLTVGVILAVVLLLILLALAGGLFNAFVTSAWMCLFMKMHAKTVPSRLVHYARQALRR